MKKILTFSLLMVGSFYLSQSITKKFNSYSNRYEYYDASGSIVAYSKYNSISDQWEYFDLKSSQQTRKPTTYRDPAQVDMSSTINAATRLQARQDNTMRNLQYGIDNIEKQLKKLNLSESEKTQFFDSFSDAVGKYISGRRSINTTTEYNNMMEWLSNTANDIINDIQSDKQNVESRRSDLQYDQGLEISNLFGKNFSVYRVAIYNDSTIKFEADEKIRSSATIRISEREIEFKRPDGETFVRIITGGGYEEEKNGYSLSTDYGAVFIHKNFDFVQFFETPEPHGKSWVYFISK
jgi:hypothetical protein